MTSADRAEAQAEAYDEWVRIVESRRGGGGGEWSAEDAATPEDHDLYVQMLRDAGVGPRPL